MTYKCDDSTEHKNQVRSKIIDVASDMFLTKGIKTVKMDDVSKELGISKRTLYEFFNNKETLLLHCMKNMKEKENLYLKNVIEQSPKLTEIGKIVEYYRYQIQQTAKISTMFVIDLKKYPVVVEWMNSIKLKNHDKVFSFFQGGIKNGYFRKNVNFELIMEFSNIAMENAISSGLLQKYGVQQVFQNVTMLYIRGFCTLKGIKELENIL